MNTQCNCKCAETHYAAPCRPFHKDRLDHEKRSWFLNDRDSLRLYEGSNKGSAGVFMNNPVSTWAQPPMAPPMSGGCRYE